MAEAAKEESKEESKEELKITTRLKLNDGNTIPILGLGLFTYSKVINYFGKTSGKELTEEEKKKEEEMMEKTDKEFKESIITAVKYGYKLLDTAQTYQTEKQISNALNQIYNNKELNIKRQDLFITTKVAPLIPLYKRSLDDIKNDIEASFKVNLTLTLTTHPK